MKGVKGIVIDPRRIELAKYATYHLQLRPGTNVALLNMMLYYIITEEVEDKQFIKEKCEGYEEMKEEILRLDMDELSAITGVDKELVSKVASDIKTFKPVEPYKGKGIMERGQYVLRKEGKKK